MGIDIFYLILFFLLGYFLGSFPTAFLITKKFTGQDIRMKGTKNVGAMNVMRLTGRASLFFFTVILDIGKGVLAVFLPQKLSFLGYNLIWATTLAGFGVILGHCFSIYFKIKEGRFSGGKAQASLIGVLAILDFQWLLLPWAGIAILFLAATQTLFFGQFMGNIFLPVIAYFFAREYFWLCLLIAIPIFLKQWPHFIPALKGARPKFYWRENRNY